MGMSTDKDLSSAPRLQILFLGANSKVLPLDLEVEVKAIDRALREAEHRDRFDLWQQWAVEVDELQNLLLRYRPHVLHVSGHGTRSGFRWRDGAPSPSPEVAPAPAGSRHGALDGDAPPSEIFWLPDASDRGVVGILGVLKDRLRCVVLNACFSQGQASAIAEHVDCVIGMGREISDLAAIRFSQAFYQALGYGRSIGQAFELGCLQIATGGLREEEIPQLICRDGVDPAGVLLLSSLAEEGLELSLEATRAELAAGDFERALEGLDALDDALRGSGRWEAERACYRALALWGGQQINTVSSNRRQSIERHLVLAHRQGPEWLLPMVLLTVIDLEFYALHGLVGPVDPPLSSEQLQRALGDLGTEEQSLIAGLMTAHRALATNRSG